MHREKLDTKVGKVSFYGQKGNHSRAQSFKLRNWGWQGKSWSDC